MSECKLILYTERDSTGDSEEFSGDRVVTNNDQASSYKMTGDCYNTAWALFEDSSAVDGGTDGTYGKGVIVGEHDKGGPRRDDSEQSRKHHQRDVHDGNLNDDGIILSGLGASGRVWPRFINHENKISFVKKIEFPEFPAGTIIEDVQIYGRRANPSYGQPDHYPYVNAMDAENPNRSNQVTATTQGQPCPGATTAVPIGDRTYRCAYENSSQIQSLYSTIKDISGIYDPRIGLYGRVVSKFCDNNENINLGVGGGLTCEDMGASRVTWCSVGERITKDVQCTTEILGDEDYDRIGRSYCIENPNTKWCECYNLSQGVCLTNMEAAGCKHAYGILDENKEALGPAIEIGRAKQDIDAGVEGAEEELARLQAQDGYPILRDNVHCRPDACERGFIPSGNVKGSCQVSYSICEQDIDIREASNSDVVVACNTGIPFKLPPWWNDPIEYIRARKPPYNKFPLNLTPMTNWPKKFRWRSKNVKYHVYSGGGISCVSCLCCIIMILIMGMSKKGKR